MPGPVVLSGGNELSPDSDALNKTILHLTDKPSPHLVVLPTAASDNPRKAARGAAGYFSAHGARVASVMISDKAMANDGASSAPLQSTDAIFLTDGNPLNVVETLSNSETLARIQRAWERGVVLAASGASAMALCDLYWDAGVWEKGLGLLKQIVVLPHYQLLVGRFAADRLREGLPAMYTILALDDSTGVVITGQEAQVIGPDTVAVYGAAGEQEYTDGDSFSLSQGISA